MKLAETLRDLIEGRPPASFSERVLAGGLAAASVPYSFATRLRSSAYGRNILHVRRLPVPVVCVGNISMGGTGKTPVTAAVAKMLIDDGHRPVIISRGYGASRRKPSDIAVVSRGDGPIAGADIAGDEPFLLSVLLPTVPVVVGADRHMAGLLAVGEFAPTIVLMDDGFQHRRLYRDVDFVLVDASRDPGKMQMFPRGTLREGFDALERASLIGVSRAKSSPYRQEWERVLREYAPSVTVVAIDFLPTGVVLDGGRGEVTGVEWLRGKRVFAFCAIGNPASFVTLLKGCGAEIVGQRFFPDHYMYGRSDIDLIGRLGREYDAECLIATDKDAIKLPVEADVDLPLASLRIGAEFDMKPLRLLLGQTSAGCNP